MVLLNYRGYTPSVVHGERDEKRVGTEIVVCYNVLE